MKIISFDEFFKTELKEQSFRQKYETLEPGGRYTLQVIDEGNK